MSTSYFIKFRFEYSCTKSIRIGIIGLDTSHSVAFTDLINGDKDNAFAKGFRIVAAYPYGSKTIESSAKRIPGYIKKVEQQGVEIVSSISELLDKVDCVLLETMMAGFISNKLSKSSNQENLLY